MITVVYFASLRERLGVAQESIELGSIRTVAELVDQLVATHGQVWQDVLKDAQVLTAVNQEMCGFDQVVADQDEVAFFPPVTGG